MPKRTTFDLAGLDIISSTPGKAKYIPFVKAWSRVTIRLKTKPVSQFRYHPRFTHVVLTRGEVWTTLRAHRIPWRSHDEHIRLTTSLNPLLQCSADFYPSSVVCADVHVATAVRRGGHPQI